MGEPTTWEDIKFEAYRAAIEARNLEIQLFWQRSNYFLVLNSAIAAGFLTLRNEAYAIPLSLLGLCAAALWVRVSVGSKFWQARWEERLHKIERRLHPDLHMYGADWPVIHADVEASLEIGPTERYPRIKRRLNTQIRRKWSVSATMILLSVAFCAFWLAVAAIAAICQLRSL